MKENSSCPQDFRGGGVHWPAWGPCLHKGVGSTLRAEGGGPGLLPSVMSWIPRWTLPTWFPICQEFSPNAESSMKPLPGPSLVLVTKSSFESQYSRDKCWKQRKGCFSQEAGHLGIRWARVQEPASHCQSGKRASIGEFEGCTVGVRGLRADQHTQL